MARNLDGRHDEQPKPDAIGIEQANEALASRRTASSGTATAMLLMEQQLLEAKLRAAERRLERAVQAVARAKEELPEAHTDKRQRGESHAWAESASRSTPATIQL